MADIAMQVEVAAAPADVYRALTSTDGVAAWWTTRNETSGVEIKELGVVDPAERNTVKGNESFANARGYVRAAPARRSGAPVAGRKPRRSPHHTRRDARTRPHGRRQRGEGHDRLIFGPVWTSDAHVLSRKEVFHGTRNGVDETSLQALGRLDP